MGVKRKNGKIFYMIFAAPSRKYLLLGISLYRISQEPIKWAPASRDFSLYLLFHYSSEVPGGFEGPRVFLKRTTESL